MDKQGQTIDLRLPEHRDEEAARKFLKQAIRRHGVPETSMIDGRAAHEAALKRYNEAQGTALTRRTRKYVNNGVEQAHRAVKRVTRLRLGFKSCEAAQATRVGIERMPRSTKRPRVVKAGDEGRTAAALFDSLAA